MAPHADYDMQVTGVTDTTAVVMPDPVLTKSSATTKTTPVVSEDDTVVNHTKSTRFTIADVLPHRQQSVPMPPGVAAFASADMFKSPHNATKPKSRRWDHHISKESASRKPSSLKGAMKYFNKDTISLCGGLPSSAYFPFEKMSLQVPRVPEFSEAESIETGGQVIVAGKHDVPEATSLYDLSIALNYGQSMGPPQLMRFVTEHTEIVHNPPYADWDICLTVGSTSALDMALRMFCEHGDAILTEEYSFSSAIETALPLGLKPVGIKMDADGLLPAHMDEILSTWNASSRGGSKKPSVLYTIPTGHNPTAATQPISRRKEIYAVAEKHDVLIIEDEPYYFLQMEDYISGTIHEITKPFTPTSSTTFLQNLIPSYLSLDTSGRVVRLDSFSKIIAPGSRTGWVTASSQIVERFVRHQEVSSQTPSGFSMMALYKLLEESWGHEGFLAWLGFIRVEYTRRRDVIVYACEKYLPTDVCSWVAPKAGMFHWIRVDARKHPQIVRAATTTTTMDHKSEQTNQLITTSPISDAFLQDTENKIFLAGVKENVLIARGSWFRAEKKSSSSITGTTTTTTTTTNGVVGVSESESESDPTLYFRMTFAAASEEQITEAVRRFGVALKKEFEIENL